MDQNKTGGSPAFNGLQEAWTFDDVLLELSDPEVERSAVDASNALRRADHRDWGDFAVFFRMNTQSRLLEEQLPFLATETIIMQGVVRGGDRQQLHEAGARGLVLFNRFYQPDLDIDRLEVVPHLALSESNELRLPLH